MLHFGHCLVILTAAFAGSSEACGAVRRPRKVLQRLSLSVSAALSGEEQYTRLSAGHLYSFALISYACASSVGNACRYMLSRSVRGPHDAG